MYAIVKTGGKQYRVERGQRLLIERLAADEGSQVTLQPLLFRSDDAVLDPAALAQVQVTAKVIEHVRGEKLRVFKFKPKRGYKRRTGHRQQLTRIEVTEIAAGKRKAQAGAGAAAGEQPAETPDAKRPPRAKAPPSAAKAPAAQKAPAKPRSKPVRAASEKAPAEGADKPAKARAAKPKPAKPKPAKPKRDEDGS
jgi:large subunit ribosomal protein L21